jgi:ATP-binding cassette subfamily F protein 2
MKHLPSMYICNILGKSTLMNVIANREIPVPAHIDIFHLSNEMPSSEKTALECVVEVNDERARLEREAEMLTSEGDQGSERL